jgi:NADH dehydrogenase
MILVVGATGLLGSEICLRLREAGRPVRALVRSGTSRERLQVLESAGVQRINGDLKDPASVREACRGATAVITTASSTLSRQEGDSIETVDRAGHLDLIEAARQAGAGRFVYTSVPQELRYDCPLMRAKREIERALAGSGLEYTVLQANYFMEVWLSPALGFDYPNGRATIYGNGDQPLAWVSYRDVAGFAVDALESDHARNKALVVGGVENLTPNEVVRIFEAAAGMPFDVTHVPVQTLENQYAAAADPLQKSFGALMLGYVRGCPMDMSETLRILPRTLASVRDYASRSVA